MGARARVRVCVRACKCACTSLAFPSVPSSPSLCRVQPEASYHPHEVVLEQEYMRCDGDVWRREERRKQVGVG